MDFPGNLLKQESPELKTESKRTAIPIPAPHTEMIELAANLLVNASNPLVIVGKGISYIKVINKNK